MGATIVLVAGSDPIEGMGGHASYVRAHARAIQRAGFEPHVVAVGARDEVVPTAFGMLHRVQSRTRLERIQAVKVRQHQLIWRVPLLVRAVEGLVRAHPGTRVIHSIGSYGCVGVAAQRALARRGVLTEPVVSAYDTILRESRAKLRGARHQSITARAVFALELAWNRLLLVPSERRGLSGSRLVLVNYESVRRILEESYGVAARVRTIPYSSEMAFLDGRVLTSPPGNLARLRPTDAPLVVAVSRHDPRKGLDVLLQALAGLRRARVPFRACLVGGGPLLRAHRRLAARLDLGASVAIEGFVANPYVYLQHADVFVLPSLEEGSGSLSLLEALQAGPAVVASGIDGILEDVEDGVTALLVPAGSSAALARALERILTDTDLRERLARRAHATFKARFGADRFSSAIRAVYAELGATP